MKILCLGDSYTVGEGIPEEDNWPSQLVHALRKRDIPMAPPTVVAKTGWTSEELLAAVAEAELTPPYEIVTLMIGVNDQYRGRAATDYTRDFEALLSRAIDLAGGRSERVFVLSIPDWSVTPYAKTETPDRDAQTIVDEIKALNAVTARICYQQTIHYIHVTEMSRDARRGELYRAPDGLHYSRKMYSHWVEHLFPRVFSTLYPGHPMHISLLYQDQQVNP